MSLPIKSKDINKIKAIAMREFIDKGYLAASTNSIVKRAEISKGTLFKYFKSKKQLYLHLISDMNTNIEQHFNKHVIKGSNWKEKLISYVEIEWLLLEELPLIAEFSNVVYRELQVIKDCHIEHEFNHTLAYQTDYLFRSIKIEDKALQNHLYYFLSGYKMRFFADHRSETNISKLKQMFINELNKHLLIIENYWRVSENDACNN